MCCVHRCGWFSEILVIIDLDHLLPPPLILTLPHLILQRKQVIYEYSGKSGLVYSALTFLVSSCLISHLSYLECGRGKKTKSPILFVYLSLDVEAQLLSATPATLLASDTG